MGSTRFFFVFTVVFQRATPHTTDRTHTKHQHHSTTTTTTTTTQQHSQHHTETERARERQRQRETEKEDKERVKREEKMNEGREEMKRDKNEKRQERRERHHEIGPEGTNTESRARMSVRGAVTTHVVKVQANHPKHGGHVASTKSQCSTRRSSHRSFRTVLMKGRTTEQIADDCACWRKSRSNFTDPTDGGMFG